MNQIAMSIVKFKIHELIVPWSGIQAKSSNKGRWDSKVKLIGVAQGRVWSITDKKNFKPFDMN